MYVHFLASASSHFTETTSYQSRSP
jgi:hypothetical protein